MNSLPLSKARLNPNCKVSPMNVLSIVIMLFVLLEGMNIFILYFFPESSKGNSVAVFDAFEKSKQDSEVHNLIKYLIAWVAGSKLIFVSLLIVIVLQGDETTLIFSVVALIISISTFFWRLYPLIKLMDNQNQISPKGYSKTLGLMIASFVLVFILALVYSLVFK
jgi:hypothetical protein